MIVLTQAQIAFLVTASIFFLLVGVAAFCVYRFGVHPERKKQDVDIRKWDDINPHTT